MQLGFALLVALAGLSCVRNFASEQPEGVCEVHNAHLSASIVRLDYGLPSAPGIAYRTARKTQFPHSYLYANGGCVRNPLFRWARVRACTKCNATEKDWLKTHRREPAEGEKSPIKATAHQGHTNE